MESDNITTPTLFNGFSHIGKSKSRYYEDRIKFGPVVTRSGLSLTLGVVADGIGGENAGERAATLTVDGVFQACGEADHTDVPEILKTALEKVNADVFKEAQQQRHKKNMGSTAAVAAIHNNRLYVANVGDSRIYLLRANKITQLTVDHTWERDVVKAGKLSPTEAAHHPRHEELVRSIGYEATVKVDLGLYFQGPHMGDIDAIHAQGMQLQPGDQIILCSDGLVKSLPKSNSHFVEPAEIIKIVTESSVNESPKLLVQKALDRNVDDNVSVIVMEVAGGKRTFRIPRLSVVAGVILSFLIIGFLGFTILSRITSTPLSLPTLPPISGNQIYIAQVWNVSLQVVIPPNGSPHSVQSGDLLDFENGEILRTMGGIGYVYIGLPGQAQLYLADDTEIIINGISDAQFEILLNQGRLLINEPGRKFLVTTPNGAQAWISGSMMGLHYNAATQELYVDCLQDMCWVNGDQPLSTNFHAILKGSQVLSSGFGTQNELWQFVPNLVATPTSTPTWTPSPTPTPIIIYYSPIPTEKEPRIRPPTRTPIPPTKPPKPTKTTIPPTK